MKIKLCLFLSMVVFIPGVDADYVPVDRFGNEQHQQPIYKTEGNKLVPTDHFGNRQYHEPSYKTEGDKIIPTDNFGGETI